jgi:hypothetical protein
MATSTKLFFSKNSWKAFESKDSEFSFSSSSLVIFLFILEISLGETRACFAMSLYLKPSFSNLMTSNSLSFLLKIV